MNRIFKRFVFNCYVPILLFLFVVSILWFIYSARERQDLNILLAIFGGLISSFYFIQKHQLEELVLFKDLFKYFNEKYDALNNDLNQITLGDTDEPLKKKEVDTLYKYFNLCSEEYLYYTKGYIYKEVWKAWCSGIEYFLEHKRIGDKWAEEEKVNASSYYNLSHNEIKKHVDIKD
jgi:hypothetical protein